MTFEIEVGGRLHRVSVERSGEGRFLLRLDGVVREVEAARAGESGLWLRLDDGASREVQIAQAGAAELLVGLEGRTVTVGVNARRTRRGPAAEGPGGQGEQPVVAPMPGRVVRLLVAAGDEVAARQPLIVVEAMKMENELRSPKAGRVAQIAVEPGMPVESGRVLLVIA